MELDEQRCEMTLKQLLMKHDIVHDKLTSYDNEIIDKYIYVVSSEILKHGYEDDEMLNEYGEHLDDLVIYLASKKSLE